MAVADISVMLVLIQLGNPGPTFQKQPTKAWKNC